MEHGRSRLRRPWLAPSPIRKRFECVDPFTRQSSRWRLAPGEPAHRHRLHHALGKNRRGQTWRLPRHRRQTHPRPVARLHRREGQGGGRAVGAVAEAGFHRLIGSNTKPFRQVSSTWPIRLQRLRPLMVPVLRHHPLPTILNQEFKNSHSNLCRRFSGFLP